MIFIYGDEGTSNDSVAALEQYFSSRFPTRCVTARDLQDPQWITSTRLFVMPGGRSLPFYASLGEKGNQQIMDFVSQGGCYLGLCAGAYYAAEKTLFALDSPLELQLQGPLNFFKGNAVGPVFAADYFAYQSELGARVVSVDYQHTIYPVYFNGGCYFEFTASCENTKVLATYADNQLPAIIQSRVGLGKAILSGVHPELSLSGTAEIKQKEAEILRGRLWERLLFDAQAVALNI